MLSFFEFLIESEHDDRLKRLNDLKAKFDFHMDHAREHMHRLLDTPDHDVETQKQHHFSYTAHKELAQKVSDEHKKLGGGPLLKRALMKSQIKEAKEPKKPKNKIAQVPGDRKDWQKEKSAAHGLPKVQDKIVEIRERVRFSYEAAKEAHYKAMNAKNIADEKHFNDRYQDFIADANRLNHEYEKLTGKKINLPKIR